MPWQSHYIHTWPNQWQHDGEVYLAHKNNSGKYHYHEQQVHRLPIKEYWHIPSHVDPDTIDYRWCPDPCDPPLIYHVPDQHQSASGAYYAIPGATDIKLVNPFIVESKTAYIGWHCPDNIDFKSVDFTWGKCNRTFIWRWKSYPCRENEGRVRRSWRNF